MVPNPATSGEGYDDCMTQYSGKTQDENAETVEESPLEEGENPLAVSHSPLLETTITMETPTICELKESIVIATGEGKKPISILNDIYCEEIAHPHLFPTVRFGYKKCSIDTKSKVCSRLWLNIFCPYCDAKNPVEWPNQHCHEKNCIR